MCPNILFWEDVILLVMHASLRPGSPELKSILDMVYYGEGIKWIPQCSLGCNTVVPLQILH